MELQLICYRVHDCLMFPWQDVMVKHRSVFVCVCVRMSVCAREYDIICTSKSESHYKREKGGWPDSMYLLGPMTAQQNLAGFFIFMVNILVTGNNLDSASRTSRWKHQWKRWSEFYEELWPQRSNVISVKSSEEWRTYRWEAVNLHHLKVFSGKASHLCCKVNLNWFYRVLFIYYYNI